MGIMLAIVGVDISGYAKLFVSLLTRGVTLTGQQAERAACPPLGTQQSQSIAFAEREYNS